MRRFLNENTIISILCIIRQCRKNENKIKNWFENKLEEDTEVVVLPEMWNNGYALDELNEKADRELSRSFPFIQSLAKQYNVDIVVDLYQILEIAKFIILHLPFLKTDIE